MSQGVSKLILTLTGLLCWTLSGAQAGLGVEGTNTVGEVKTIVGQGTVKDFLSRTDLGHFSASLETNNVAYVKDQKLGFSGPEDSFGSNSYLKMDYVNGRFSAGMQLESYLPALYGFELGQQPDVKKFWLASKYIRWNSDWFTIHVGDIYDQMGNGLIFRSYEDRNLGFNNSLEGIQLSFNLNDWFSIKGLYGRPRLYTAYAGSWVRGASATVSFNDIFGWDSVLFNIEGNYLNRYESLGKDSLIDFGTLGLEDPNLHSYSAALNFAWNGLSLKAEYAGKTKDLYAATAPKAKKGAAIYAEAIYGIGGFSASANFRIIDHLGTMLSLYGNGTGNTLNYLPSLTRQYHYLLANLNPYQVNVEGECAAQLDLFYTLRSRSDRNRYWIFRVNGSTAWTIDKGQTDDGSQRMLWLDVSADAECHWMKQLKTTFLYSRQQWSPSHGYEAESYASNIFVADVQYKFNRKYALRGELQYLYSKSYERDWIAALVEFTFAPQWSIYASEMYNLGETKKHYYNAGVSWSKGKTRVQLSYGRNRAGYICSGGVCRYSPAYTGVNLLLTAVF